jgi:hypothetical protein
MPAKQMALLAGIIVFFCAVVALTFWYGPGQRSYLSPPQVLSVHSTDQIAQEWKTAGVKGRSVICFTRYLNAHEEKESRASKITELSLEQGIVRRVFHILPDKVWPEVRETLSKRNGIRPASAGFIGIFDYGRVYIMPLSRFSQLGEKALVIIEPKVWTATELQQIATMLKSGSISSDLVILIRGTETEAAPFRAAVAP